MCHTEDEGNKPMARVLNIFNVEQAVYGKDGDIMTFREIANAKITADHEGKNYIQDKENKDPKEKPIAMDQARQVQPPADELDMSSGTRIPNGPPPIEKQQRDPTPPPMPPVPLLPRRDYEAKDEEANELLARNANDGTTTLWMVVLAFMEYVLEDFLEGIGAWCNFARCNLADSSLGQGGVQASSEQLPSSLSVAELHMQAQVDTGPNMAAVQHLYSMMLAETEMGMTGSENTKPAPAGKTLNQKDGKNDGASQKVCRFWKSDGGCRNGAQCSYQHPAREDGKIYCYNCGSVSHRRPEWGVGDRAMEVKDETENVKKVKADGDTGHAGDQKGANEVGTGETKTLVSQVSSLIKALKSPTSGSSSTAYRHVKAVNIRKIDMGKNQRVLIDGGATHVRRKARSQEEWDRGDLVQVALASGTTDLKQDVVTGSLLTLHDVLIIIPMAALTQLGYEVKWTGVGCSIGAPDGTQLPIQPSSTGSTLPRQDGIRILQQVEALKTRETQLRLAALKPNVNLLETCPEADAVKRAVSVCKIQSLEGDDGPRVVRARHRHERFGRDDLTEEEQKLVCNDSVLWIRTLWLVVQAYEANSNMEMTLEQPQDLEEWKKPPPDVKDKIPGWNGLQQLTKKDRQRTLEAPPGSPLDKDDLLDQLETDLEERLVREREPIDSIDLTGDGGNNHPDEPSPLPDGAANHGRDQLPAPQDGVQGAEHQGEPAPAARQAVPQGNNPEQPQGDVPQDQHHDQPDKRNAKDEDPWEILPHRNEDLKFAGGMSKTNTGKTRWLTSKM
eukprot:s1047_g9.t1